MAPLELDGDTLGKKHQHFNKLVSEALKTNQLHKPPFNDDIQTLLNIEIASKNRNVDFILDVPKSEDQLYVSKAIKRCTWLVTDPQYAHIINPEYLYTKLHPQITTKAFNKLMLHTRLHLKDEKRVDVFYNYIKEKDSKTAYKWLQNCSVSLVEKEIAKHQNDIPDYIILRLFEKSFSIFEAYAKDSGYWIRKECQILLNRHAEKFLDVIDKFKDGFSFNFTAKSTKIMMQKFPQRILNNFELYGKKVHMATFVKYLNRTENIKDFLLKYAKNEKFQWMFKYNSIQYFIKQMPKESRFEFVKTIFIDKDVVVNSDSDYCRDDVVMLCSMQCRSSQNTNSTNTYQWYKFAPFDTAFTDLKKLIRAESVPEQRNLMLMVLMSCAGRNSQHTLKLLQYYFDKHINEPFKFKIQFINYFISHVQIDDIDDQTWNILNQIFHSMEVFIKSDNNVQSCVKAIIVRQVIRKQEIPDIIKEKFVFETLKSYIKKLKKQNDKDAVFKYLFDFIIDKSNSLDLTVETQFNEAVMLCEHLLNLIQDWGKDLSGYPYALDKIKELIKIKQEKQWSHDLSPFYDIKKPWRRAMFEESIVLLPTEEVCVNALKHDPTLLARNKEKVLTICCNDTVPLKRLLSKIRIYWPNTLAKDWQTEYLKRLDHPVGHKAVMIGLCALLPHDEINTLLNKYAPAETKINWDDTDQLKLSLCKQIAKNVYQARPLAPVDGILLYAKGDYLQFVIPSLNAVFSQLSPNKSRVCIPKLLDAPVSLQKFGVRCAFQKLTTEELKPMFTKIWNSTKNSSIRTVIFTSTFTLMCKDSKESHVNDIWALLSTFIDNLTPDEDKLLFKKLSEVSKVPKSIRPQFYMKSYSFLNSLPAKSNCESLLNDMQYKAIELMESLKDEFVVQVLLKKYMESFNKERRLYQHGDIIAAFILNSKNEKTQLRRYQISVGAILEKYLPIWYEIEGEQYQVKNNVNDVLRSLADLNSTIEHKMTIPLKTFENILQQLEETLSYHKEYVVITLWKLMVAFAKVLSESDVIKEYYREIIEDDTKTDRENMLTKAHEQMAPQFAKLCVQHLKQDLERFGSSIYSLFSQSLVKLFDTYMSRSLCSLGSHIEYIKSLLQYENEREVWLVAHRLLETEINYYYSDNEKQKFEEIRKVVFSHPSDEIKMHFYALFADNTPFVPKPLSS